MHILREVSRVWSRIGQGFREDVRKGKTWERGFGSVDVHLREREYVIERGVSYNGRVSLKEGSGGKESYKSRRNHVGETTC